MGPRLRDPCGDEPTPSHPHPRPLAARAQSHLASITQHSYAQADASLGDATSASGHQRSTREPRLKRRSRRTICTTSSLDAATVGK
eukprot:1926293-Pyramimonas_sp.AAC.1